MTKRNSIEKTFVGYEFLPAKPTFNSIEIYHPFASLASEYFSKMGFDILPLKSGTIMISFKDMNSEERKALSDEVKKFFKVSRGEVIKDFLIYKKNGITYL